MSVHLVIVEYEILVREVSCLWQLDLVMTSRGQGTSIKEKKKGKAFSDLVLGSCLVNPCFSAVAAMFGI